jgi:two-component system phosphate regulon response regulator PhoB
VSGSTVLVIDDEPRIVEFLVENLRADDYTVLTAANGGDAIEVLTKARPTVILLDVVLPDMSGYELCRRIRSAHPVTDGWDPDVPIIMISAKVEYTDRVRGLTRGADDYVTKPFHYPELVARIAAVQSRATRVRDRHVHQVRDLVVNTLSRDVTAGGMKVGLSAKEFELLAKLAADPERVFSKAELLETVWGFRSPGRTRTLDSHASRLRQKLAAHSAHEWIVNVWGVGYRLYKPE